MVPTRLERSGEIVEKWFVLSAVVQRVGTIVTKVAGRLDAAVWAVTRPAPMLAGLVLDAGPAPARNS
jgi:hypothetical protein